MRFHISMAALGGLLVASSMASGATIFGVANVGGSLNLVQFESATPADLDSSLAIGGLNANESILGIDFRPATGQLFGVTSQNRLVTINTSTAAVTTVGALGLVLNGTAFGFDFNPQIDAIRVVSETDRNYVINPNTGTATAATNLFYAAGDPNVGANPNVTASAYDNNTAGAMPTQLYGIDTNLNILVRQANSAGTLTTVGPLGSVDPSAVTGFDVESGTNTAFAALLPQGGSVSNLYTINLATGLATAMSSLNNPMGQINGGLQIIDIAVAIPEPTTLAALAGTGMIFGRRRRA